MKKALFLGSLFLSDVEKDIVKNTKSGIIQYAANNYQKAIIDGLSLNMRTIEVVSAPFIGAYPKHYKTMYFKNHDRINSPYHVRYVNFNNAWGYKNISRAFHLKRVIRKMDLSQYKEVYVYSAHTPFLEAAKTIKKKYPNIKTCLFVPDLPEYMNLSNKQPLIYRILKNIDNKKQVKLMKYIDSFVLITEAMKDKLPVFNKPYEVMEAIATTSDVSFDINSEAIARFDEISKLGPTILYTGTLNERFGIIDLLEAFKKPFLNAQLVICGDGDTKTRLYEIIKTRTHIHYLGNLTNKEAVALQQRATILVNPRSNEEDFTKYSFPYKTVEYLKSGRPVVMARLSGIPSIYENYINYLDSTKPEDIKIKLEELLNLTKEELDKKGAKGRAFILENKTPEKALKNVCAMIEKL